MQQYILRRLLLVVVSAIAVAVVIFLMVRLTPGDVAVIFMGDTYEPNRAPIIRQQLGLDQPIYRQFVSWVGSVFTGEWTSFFTGRPVLKELWQRVPVSAELGLLSLAIALLIAFPLGIISAVRYNSVIDHQTRVLAVVGLAIPDFWLALLVILSLVSFFGWSPPIMYVSFAEDPWTHFQQMVFPALIVGFSASASIMRLLRTGLLEVLRSDYIRTAWSKGLRERVVLWRHALKNAMIPVLTVIGLDLGRIVGGLVIVESIFTLPGAGRLMVQSILIRDYPQIQANIIFLALSFLVMNLLTDIAYAWVDPRIRYH